MALPALVLALSAAPSVVSAAASSSFLLWSAAILSSSILASTLVLSLPLTPALLLFGAVAIQYDVQPHM
jgi:hypothetical protein